MPASFKILLSPFLICFFVNLNAFAKDSLTELLPRSLDGWKKSETTEMYNRKNLFDYINGGAELYLAYDFEKLVVQTYTPEQQDSVNEISITVEIWQTNSSADAYGIFSFDQEEEEVTIGQSGIYSDGLLRFWKNNFFVRILGLDEDAKEIILKLGSGIDKKIKQQGKLPQLVSQIPSDSLIPGSIHFFHKQIILNNLYFLSDQNILSLNEQTNCVLAELRLGKTRLKLLVIQYPDTVKAQEAQESFKRFYLRDKSSVEGGIFETKEKKVLGMDLEDNYFILVFEGKDKKSILWLLNSAKSSLSENEQ